MLAERWATAKAEHTTRDAGEPGVRLRCYLDLKSAGRFGCAGRRDAAGPRRGTALTTACQVVRSRPVAAVRRVLRTPPGT
ncbi:DUF6207 family protein (plasmid) [Streptomyces mirabilis]|uniref:DUF6207 family protein n=1 Tax=Streptomyces mirabilis TaxID=68239 RepID=A0ABU3V5P7_9ACTN|nr:DUF6207 family protein [Streptomyces mirabilis]MCX5355845.1 DUF6207 family protein [Streptomyces mirabilis]MDU9001486.1 DUF6207 family protein [Streptomyces mirabilis]